MIYDEYLALNGVRGIINPTRDDQQRENVLHVRRGAHHVSRLSQIITFSQDRRLRLLSAQHEFRKQGVPGNEAANSIKHAPAPQHPQQLPHLVLRRGSASTVCWNPHELHSQGWLCNCQLHHHWLV